VLDPNDDRAPTNRANADKLCSKPDCHPGAKTNFAMSGANHLRLKIKEDVVLRTIDLFFRSLTICVIGFMLGGIGLDLRRKVFGPHPPKCGRPVGLLIVASFASLLTAIGCAAFSIATVATRALLAAVVLLGVAYVLYFATRKKGVASAPVKKHRRFSKTQRIQHIALMICFTTLIMTGLPQRFSDVLWLRSVYQFIGGLSGAREIHRVAAIGLISVFVWHTTDLFIRWAKLGFKLNALTMLPTKKDALDFLHMSECYLGLRKEEPRFDRFQFKQKMDYLAEYWGVPLMVVTGFIMWFPIYWANRLPEIALSAALVAHGWEATLAFLAIIAWHIYNEHFNPDAFPMSKVWLTGELTEEEMLREHPLELERIQKNDGGAAAE
jgi:cytochrome b subunit of formate dehydrogenase